MSHKDGRVVLSAWVEPVLRAAHRRRARVRQRIAELQQEQEQEQEQETA